MIVRGTKPISYILVYTIGESLSILAMKEIRLTERLLQCST